jgi:branched chain amino acid efflux pump
MCDESWAMGLSDARQLSAAGHQLGFSLPYYLEVAAGLYLTWIVSTAIGAALGPAMGDVKVYGFDMAFPAVFLVLLRGMWKGVRAARPWLVSLLAALSVVYVIPAIMFYVIARRALQSSLAGGLAGT